MQSGRLKPSQVMEETIERSLKAQKVEQKPAGYFVHQDFKGMLE
jgi:hypothetical protein